MRGFLWCQSKPKRGKAKVAWEEVCLPRQEGGLGIRRLDSFNSALMVSHIWKLLTLKESMWVKWIHEYKLKGRSFWDILIRGNMSWSWKKLLQLRPLVREFFWSKIGNGSSTSLWFDRWCDIGPLCNIVTTRDMYRAGLSTSSKVKDIIQDGNWVWPSFLTEKYPVLVSCVVPINMGSDDVIVWRSNLGIHKKFSVSQVWKSIHPRSLKVDWYGLVWFNACIPRHAFNMWLVVKKKLKTQDRMSVWDINPNIGTVCSLCALQADSHEHLFFSCTFSQSVWNHMQVEAGINASANDIYSLIDYLLPFASRRTSRSVITKLVIAATTYFIWQERNRRLFKNNKRTTHQIIDCIMASVRLKLMSCKFKRSRDAEELARKWDLPTSIFVS